jgi:hypothetical protein
MTLVTTGIVVVLLEPICRQQLWFFENSSFNASSVEKIGNFVRLGNSFQWFIPAGVKTGKLATII